MVGNIRYVQDDLSESEQCYLTSKPYQSNQPEFGHKYYDDIGYRASARHECTCTGDCDNYDRHVSQRLDDSIKQHHELYSELAK